MRALVTPTAGANTTGTGLPKRVVGISDGYICASSGGGSWDQDMILGFDRDTNSGVVSKEHITNYSPYYFLDNFFFLST